MINLAKDVALNNSKEILRGAVSINPILDTEADACKYCAMKGVCGFDARIPGYAKRKLSGEKASEEEKEEE